MSNEENNTSLEKIITTAIQIPGVKVERNSFLSTVFKHLPSEKLAQILEEGPIVAGCGRAELKKIAKSIVDKRTVVSSGASFVAGLPGGLTMAATIPADMLQFYAVALRLAQEIAYIYGESDLWEDGRVNDEKVTNQLILYYGVMLGASGASATVRVISSALAKQMLKKLPQKALTKTFYYPIVKTIAKAVGIKMTKNVFAKGVSKAIPIVGGVVSGGITFLSMRPMGNRLIDTFDECHFDYTKEEFEADWREINSEEYMTDVSGNVDGMESYETFGDKFSEVNTSEGVVEKLKELKELYDMGIITEEEFLECKTELLKKYKK